MTFEEFSIALDNIAQRFMMVREFRKVPGTSETPMKELLAIQEAVAEKALDTLYIQWKEAQVEWKRPTQERIEEMSQLHNQWMKDHPELARSAQLTWDDTAQHLGIPPEEFRFYWDAKLRKTPT